MVEITLHSAPEDTPDPYPVTMARLEEVLRRLGTDTDLAHFAEEQATFDTGALTYDVSFFGRRDYLSVRTSWDPLPGASLPHLFTAVNSWNRLRHFPTTYLDRKKDGSLTIVGDMVIHCRHGLSDLQLEDEVAHAVECCSRAVEYVAWASSQMQDLP